MKILTVIVPTYNMEKYLDKCLTSLIVPDQSLMDQLEVLVVNDGSKDRSSEIAHGYESRYPNTFKVIDKQNGNYGSCINAALPVATGKYLKVLDADDWFETSILRSVIAELGQIDTDLFVTDFIEVDEFNNKGQGRSMKGLLKEREVLPFQVLFDTGNLKAIWMYQIIYRTSIFSNLDYHQTEGISYTDNEWSVLPFLNVRNLYYYPKVLYFYLVGREGQTMDKAQLIKKSGDFIKVLFSMLDFLKRNNDNTIQSNYIHECTVRFAIGRVYRMCLDEHLMPEMKLREMESQMRQKYPQFYSKLSNERILINSNFYPLKYWRWHILWLFRNPLMNSINKLRVRLNLGRFIGK